MLGPGNRLTLIDALRPPQGHVFDAAMAVTFTLDLRALLAAPAAFALAQTDHEAPDDGVEPVELLHAIRTYSSRITVFAQAGQIALPPSRRVFAFLEKSVVSVTAPRHGIVHPKVWVVRYLDDDGTARLRVLVGSRNLTFDASWDTMLRLDETEGRRGSTLSDLPRLFETMSERGIGGVDEAHRTRIESLCEHLAKARFAVPAGVDELSLHVLGLDDSPAPFPDSFDRSMVVSPYVSDSFFSSVMNNRLDELVARPEELDGLAPSVLERVGHVYAFDDGSTPELEVAEDALAADDPGRPIRGLHAKLFAFEHEGSASVFCGSANATGPAFANNVEVLVGLHGSRKVLGIDALCGGTEDELGLRQLFHTYVRGDEGNGDGPGDGLDGLRQALGALAVRGLVEPDGEGWRVTYSSVDPVVLRDGTEAACWPLGTAGHRKRVESGSPLGVSFPVSLEGISGFLGFELTSPEHDRKTEFVIPVILDGLPDERDGAVLRLLIGSADRFLRYLLALLSDDPSEMEVLDAVETAADADANGSAAPSLPVLETMLRTLRRDPARLLAVDPIIRDLATDDALPPGFLDLWSELHAAALEVTRR